MTPIPGWSLFRGYDRELTCSRCRAVIAWIRIRPFALLQIRDPAGHQVTPLGGSVAMRVMQSRLGRLAEETPPPYEVEDHEREVARVHRDIGYLRKEAGEVIYELECVCGARYLRSLPHLTAGVRRATGSRVELR